MNFNVNKAFDSNETNRPTSSGDIELSMRSEIPAKKKFNDLVVTRNRPTHVPSLFDEVRTLADAVKFADCATLVLNNPHIETEVIVRDLIAQMMDNAKLLNVSGESALNELLISNTDEEGNYLQFAKTINGFEHSNDGTMTVDPSWLIAMASLDWIDDRLVGITTTLHPINMGASHSSVQMLAIVLTPVKEKPTKSDVETSRNIAAVLSQPEFRQHVHGKYVTEESFRKCFKETTINLQSINAKDYDDHGHSEEHEGLHGNIGFGRGIWYDLKRRSPHYLSDYKDSFNDRDAIVKTLTTVFVLFFANLLPTIAFGMLNETSTKGKINVSAGLVAQVIGGIVFAIFGGQQMVVMLTTSPLSIMIMVFYKTSEDLELDFFQFYTMIGIFNTLYLFIFSFTGLSRIMKYSRRSTEETFALFVSITFIVDSVMACVSSFKSYYHGEKCIGTQIIGCGKCLKEESLLFLLLLLGTMAFGLWLNGLTRTPFLNSLSRKMIAEFALPVSVLFMAFVGSYVFKEVKLHTFKAPAWQNTTIKAVNLTGIKFTAVGVAAAMAIPLSILIFMEQNIASSILNSPLNKLKKGTAYHWDIMVIGVLNLILSFLGLPWVHGALPHSPMHLTALATIEDHVDEGNHIKPKVVKVVETRIPAILANILVGCCIFLMPYPLLYIPAPVLNGLFLYMAFTGLDANQLFERLLLFITEQSAYPPNHYLKRVPQIKVHVFTLIQAFQLVVLCVLGFAPNKYVKMAFPLILILQLPFRHKIFPKIIKTKYLDALDRFI